MGLNSVVVDLVICRFGCIFKRDFGVEIESFYGL